MQSATAKTKHIRITPRKARLAADLIRGKSVEEAAFQLMYCNLKAGRLLGKTLKSAIANAETQLNLRRENLKVSEVKVDAGPVMKRAKSRSKGGRAPVMKRTSHFTIVVSG
jgi:large subunit ribosomal protein L22